MNERWISRCGWLAGAVLIAGIVWSGCEIRSSSSVERTTLYIAGLYRNSDGSRIVDRNSGAAVRSLSVQQRGDRVEAVDNNGRLFRGSFIAESDTRGTLELRGTTTAGVEVTISGTISVAGSKAYLNGTWIEPALFGAISAQADVVSAPAPTNTNTTVTL